MTSITKKCVRCGEVKNGSEFYGANTCKACVKQKVKEWVKNNPDRRKEIANKYARENKGVLDTWRAKNPEKVNASKRKYYKKNRLDVRSAIKNWFTKNPDKTSEYKRNRRARLEGVGGTVTAKEWKEVVVKYGNKCLCCNRTDVKLTLDHVVPLSLGGSHSVDNVQPLCLTCNLKKATKVIDFRRYI